MTAWVRIGLRTASAITLLVTAWLVATIVAVLPSRDPDRIALWTVVAVAAAALVAVSILVTRTDGAVPGRAEPVVAALSAAALCFGAFVLASTVAADPAGHFEGYLVAIGAVLAVHGALGLAWLVARRR